MKRIKLDLKELEAELSSMEMEETRILLGGTGYEDYGKDDMDPDNNDGKYMDYNPDTGAWFDTGEKGSNNGNIETGGNSNNQWDENDFPDNGYENDDRDYDRGDNEGNQSGQGNNNGGNGPEYMDGLSSTDMNNIIFGNGLLDGQKFSVFSDQLKSILASNHALADMINSLNGPLKFEIAPQLSGSSSVMVSGTSGANVLTVYVNPDMLDYSKGWDYDVKTGTQHDGVNYSNLTPTEDFAAALAHEVIHLQHRSLLLKAVENVGNQSPSDLSNYMLNVMKVDPEIVNMYFTKDQNGNIDYDNADNINDKSHAYMSDPSNGVTDSIMEVVKELREDSQKIQSRIQGLEQGMSEMEQDKNDPDGRYNEKAFNEMLSEHRNLSEQYGWMWK